MLAGIEEPSLLCQRRRDLSIGYLDQYAAISLTASFGREMVASLRRCGNLEETSAKAAEQLGDPDLLSDPVAYELALKRYDQLQKGIQPEERVWLRV